MKRKYAAIMLGLALTVTSMNVYAADTTDTAEATEEAADTTETADTETEENQVSGEVKTTAEDSITIAVGTLNNRGGGNMGKPDGEAPDGEAAEDAAPAEDTEDSSEASEAAEEATASADEGVDDADAAADESALADGEKPSMIELTGEEQTIAITEDTVIQKEAMSQAPDGEAPDGEAPDGEAPDGEEADGEAPDGEAPDETEAPAEPAEDGEGQGREIAYETITLADIVEGDIVTITLDEDGNAATITVVSQHMGGGEKPDGEAADGTEETADGTEETADSTEEAAE